MQIAFADESIHAVRAAQETFHADKLMCMRNFLLPGSRGISRGTRLMTLFKEYIKPYNDYFGEHHVPRDAEAAEDESAIIVDDVQTKIESTPDHLRAIKEHILLLPTSEQHPWLKQPLKTAEIEKLVSDLDKAIVEATILIDPSEAGDTAATVPTKKKIAILGPTRAGKSFLVNAFLESTQKLQSQYNLARNDLEQMYPLLLEPEHQSPSNDTDPRRWYPAELLNELQKCTTMKCSMMRKKPPMKKTSKNSGRN